MKEKIRKQKSKAKYDFIRFLGTIPTFEWLPIIDGFWDDFDRHFLEIDRPKKKYDFKFEENEQR